MSPGRPQRAQLGGSRRCRALKLAGVPGRGGDAQARLGERNAAATGLLARTRKVRAVAAARCSATACSRPSRRRRANSCTFFSRGRALGRLMPSRAPWARMPGAAGQPASAPAPRRWDARWPGPGARTRARPPSAESSPHCAPRSGWTPPTSMSRSATRRCGLTGAAAGGGARGTGEAPAALSTALHLRLTEVDLSGGWLLRLKAVTDDPIVWQTNHLCGAPTPVSPQTGIPFEVPSAGFYLNLPALSAEDGQTGAFWLGAGPAWSLPNARWRGAVVCLRATGSRSPTTPRVTSGAAWAKARTGLAAAEDACWDKAATTITPDATAASRWHPDRPRAGRGHLDRRALRPPAERAHQRRDLRRQRIRRRALDHPRRRRGVRHGPKRRFRLGRGHRHRCRRLARPAGSSRSRMAGTAAG